MTILKKKCYDCKLEKELSEFNKDKVSSDGHDGQCRRCKSAYRKLPEVKERSLLKQREWRRRTPEKQKEYSRRFRESENGKIKNHDWQLRVAYGITVDKYNEMFAKQNGCCAICGIHQSKLTKRLNVDHDHETGQIRELLCGYCNTSLGNFKESVALLIKAKEYLEKHKNLQEAIS